MSKILYIGNYRDNTSWGKLCRDYVLAMARTDHDIVCRPLVQNINPQNNKVSELIESLESKDSKGAEICIQQVPIQDAVVDYGFAQQVFIFGSLKRRWRNSEIESLKRFNNCTVLCTNQSTLEAFSKITRTNNVLVQPISYPRDLWQNEFQETTSKLNFLDSPSYKFYFIGKISARKNIIKLLQAFYLEFDKDENVDLVIKATAQTNQPEFAKALAQAIEKVVTGIGKYPSVEDYRQPLIIAGWSEDENLIQLHKSCNCFVSPSWAEYQDVFVEHARLAGNQAICKEVFDDAGPERLVLETQTMSFVQENLDRFEVIEDFDLVELKSLMRAAYENRDLFKTTDKYKVDFTKLINSVL